MKKPHSVLEQRGKRNEPSDVALSAVGERRRLGFYIRGQKRGDE